MPSDPTLNAPVIPTAYRTKSWAQGPGFATFFYSRPERDAWIAADPARRSLRGPDVRRAQNKCNNRDRFEGGDGKPVKFLE